MVEEMPGSGGGVLAVELRRTYNQHDILKMERLLDRRIAEAGGRINLLLKLDALDLGKVDLENYIEDCRRTLERRDNLSRVAVVGDSEMARRLVSMDNLVMANATRGITERYFDVSEIAAAWEFVQG